MMKSNVRGASVALVIGSVLSALGLGIGCGDSESTNPVSSSSSTGAGAAGGTSTVPAGGGGAGGSGGSTTANGGSGGSGGAPEACIAASKFSDLFTIQDSAFCAVAIYEGPAPITNTVAPGPIDFHGSLNQAAITFGSQGGPVLTIGSATAGSVDVLRATPHDATFTLAKNTAAAAIPAGAFLGIEAVDLGFFGWTAIGYAGAFPATQGELILLKGTAVAKRYPVNSIFSMGSILETHDKGRVIYTGLSKLDDAATAVNALYAADSCGTSTNDPALEGCGAPIEVEHWGDYSGPVAVDALGNAFAVMTSSDGSQEAHGYAKKQIAFGAGPAVGATMFTLDGFGTPLAAIAPTATEDGILAFQPSDGTTFKSLDVVAQRYHQGSDALTATGTPTPLLVLGAEDIALSMATDASSKLWVAATRGSGSDTKLVFVVIDKKP